MENDRWRIVDTVSYDRFAFHAKFSNPIGIRQRPVELKYYELGTREGISVNGRRMKFALGGIIHMVSPDAANITSGD